MSKSPSSDVRSAVFVSGVVDGLLILMATAHVEAHMLVPLMQVRDTEGQLYGPFQGIAPTGLIFLSNHYASLFLLIDTHPF